ncbi:MAG TPA: FAD-dependent oxidoreductase, partial [Alphaproteobacteria bacterium]|nr:FAD-dependent oxidoreductase [Pelagibacteraceae bacterium]HJO13476.1 FAD-dependent oxidoreductase [Alphaproteobacteria bacterium]
MSKVAVIGAGIIGVCIAFFLKKNGHKVTLIDQNNPGTQTSFGNAG